ncbi:hypothetical protein MJO28_003806 [Puccinia striiformis f. sp. tritici]|uniref:Uncharacterized protein n=1 Tax=Puccinia striiformis f. sp. tritici TaxID=168172 RepID=A0ACC0EMM6_9BASI|nr:hypothetical protein MJO28_003806 [Puccinia striiformis f. sp. tritici]
MNVPAEFLVFTDESAVCGRDLLRTFAPSERGQPAARYMKKQNSSRLSVLPAISINGMLTITVRDDTFNGKKFEHSLKWDLIITPECCTSLYRHCGYAMPCGLEDEI